MTNSLVCTQRQLLANGLREPREERSKNRYSILLTLNTKVVGFNNSYMQGAFLAIPR
jgi:hypothetical protein